MDSGEAGAGNSCPNFQPGCEPVAGGRVVQAVLPFLVKRRYCQTEYGECWVASERSEPGLGYMGWGLPYPDVTGTPLLVGKAAE